MDNFRKDFDKAFECSERASYLARQPQELQLVTSEFILLRANREAQIIFDAMPSE